MKGADFFNDTNTHTGKWFKIYVTASATFNAVISNWSSFPTAIAFAAGTEFYGQFTSIDLTSGSIIAYRL